MKIFHLILAVIILVGCGQSQPKGKCRAFDSGSWKNADAGTRQRAYIADRTLSNCTLTGITKSKIISILGPPTNTTKFRNWDLVYVLGPEDGFISIDYEWLVIDLDKNDRVATYDRVTD